MEALIQSNTLIKVLIELYLIQSLVNTLNYYNFYPTQALFEQKCHNFDISD